MKRRLNFRFLSLSLLVSIVFCRPSHAAENASSAKAATASPALYVMVVVDQLRGDELTRYDALWEHGLRTLIDEGHLYTQAHHGHGRTETAAGHASVATGTHPRYHGIVDKRIFDRATGQIRHVCAWGAIPCAPTPLLLPTVGDRLKRVSPTSKVVSLAQKARSAMLMGGQDADLVAWFSANEATIEGRFEGVPGVPPWLHRTFKDTYRASDPKADWQRPALPEPFASWKDTHAGESDNCGHGRVFPHRMPSDNHGALWRAWRCTPKSDATLVPLVESALKRLQLGQDDTPDLLLVSFSAVDVVGHAFGPDSVERAAVLKGLDRTLGTLLEALQKAVPRERLWLGLTADHGVAPTVPMARDRGHDADLVPVATIQDTAERVWREHTLAHGLPWRDRHTTVSFPYIHLVPRPDNPALLDAMAAALQRLPGIAHAWPVRSLDSIDHPIARLMAENAHPERGGDVVVVLKPYHLPSYRAGDTAEGADHGSPWRHDRHVPIVRWPAPQGRRIDTPVRVIDLTRSLSEHMGLKPLEHQGNPLPGL